MSEKPFHGLGPAVLSLNASQAVAWNSPDAGEREEMRAAMRRRANELLEQSPRCASVEIRERDRVLELVERQRW